MQTFRELREQNCYYVDKTAYVERMLREGKHYFLSRPRRFGKSLFLDTLKELFEGSEELFAGLHIHARHDWSERHPVVRLSFGGGSFTEPANVNTSALAQLEAEAERAGMDARYATAPERFAHLLRTLHTHSGRRVAVLVDEYDKPILDAPVIRRAEPRPAAAAAAAGAAHPSATNAGSRSACRRSASCGSGTATTSTSRPSSSGCRLRPDAPESLAALPAPTALEARSGGSRLARRAPEPGVPGVPGTGS